jgi:hypothetical protein
VRRRWWVLGVVGVLLVGGTTGVLVTAARYDPLEVTSMGTGPGPTSEENDGRDQTYTWAYREGGEINFSIWVHNAGPWGVRITSVDMPPPGYHMLLRPVEVRIGRDGGPVRFDVAGTEPFRPFDLAANTGRVILVVARMGDCAFFPDGGATGIDAVPLHFSVLGLDHRVQAPLLTHLRVSATPKDCPRPSQVPRAG